MAEIWRALLGAAKKVEAFLLGGSAKAAPKHAHRREAIRADRPRRNAAARRDW